MIDEMKLIEEIKSMVRPLLTPDGTAWFDDVIQAHNETLADVLNTIEKQPNENDYKLFNLLEKLNNKNIKWGMSNVFENRNIKNEHLIKWCNDNQWNVYHLNRNYNPFSRGNSNNDEVYICNYNK